MFEFMRRTNVLRDGVVEVDALVLGGGIAGIVSATMLGKGGALVVLVDHYESLGGNHKSRSIGPYTYDIGTFLFGESDILFSLFPEALAKCLSVRIAVGRITPSGRLERYPYNSKTELFQHGFVHAAASIASVAGARLWYSRRKTAADFAKFYMGPKIYRDSGLENYIARLFGVPAVDIEVEFAAKRLTWIPRAASIRR